MVKYVKFVANETNNVLSLTDIEQVLDFEDNFERLQHFLHKLYHSKSSYTKTMFPGN